MQVNQVADGLKRRRGDSTYKLSSRERGLVLHGSAPINTSDVDGVATGI